MKKFWVLSLSLLLFLGFDADLFAGQFKFGWNFVDSAGGIQEMHFMPGDSEFICTTTGNTVQIRSTATGELRKQFNGTQGFFDFTPDSQRIVTVFDKKIELHNLSDMSLINSDSLKLGNDTIDSHGNKMRIMFLGLAVDPIRPYAYVLVKNGNFFSTTNPYRIDTLKVIVYDYITMKQIKVLNPEGFKLSDIFGVLAVSKDGKYLAVINDLASELKVWDLESMKLIRNLQLYDPNRMYESIPEDLKFSEINTNDIYFSGEFTKMNASTGLQKYNINSNSIIDSTFKYIGYRGKIILFDDEERSLYPTSVKLIRK